MKSLYIVVIFVLIGLFRSKKIVFNLNKLKNNVVDGIKGKNIYSLYLFGKKITYLKGPQNLRFLNKIDGIVAKNQLFPFWKKLLGNILLINDGEYHKFMRKTLMTVFTEVSLNEYKKEMEIKIKNFLDDISTGREINVFDEIGHFIFKLNTDIIFGKNKLTNDNVNDIFTWWQGFNTVPINIKLFGYKTKYAKALDARIKIRNKCFELIKNDDRSEFIQYIIDNNNIQDENVLNDIVDNLMFFIIASQDTTSAALTSVIANVNNNIGTSETDIQAYIKEVLRLYPPSSGTPKVLEGDVFVDGEKLKKNELVAYTTYGSHFDPIYGNDVESFNPKRFIDENGKIKNYGSHYIPFGTGAHKCLGSKYAKLTIDVFLKLLLQNYDVSVLEKKNSRISNSKIRLQG